jgi:hypothetical protein
MNDKDGAHGGILILGDRAFSSLDIDFKIFLFPLSAHNGDAEGLGE